MGRALRSHLHASCAHTPGPRAHHLCPPGANSTHVVPPTLESEDLGFTWGSRTRLFSLPWPQPSPAGYLPRRPVIRTHACLRGATWWEATCSPAPTSLHPATRLLVPCLAGQRDRHHIREGDAASSLSGGHEQPLPVRAPTRLRLLSPTRGSPHVATYQAPAPTGQGWGPDPHSPPFGLLKHQVSVNRAQRKGAGPTGGPLGRTG